jgi:hypothetical protein
LNQILPAGLGPKYFAGEEMDDDTASEDEKDDTANEGAAFENIMPAKTSFKHSNPLSSEDLALIETTTHLKRQNQLRWRMERKLSS